MGPRADGNDTRMDMCYRVGGGGTGSQNVTGPSLVRLTRMWAPNLPVATRSSPSRARAALTARSNSSSPWAGEAAEEKPGRSPRRVSAASVNWGTSSSPPPVSSRLRLTWASASANTPAMQQSGDAAVGVRRRVGRVRPPAGSAGPARLPTVLVADLDAGAGDPLQKRDHSSCSGMSCMPTKSSKFIRY